MKSVAAEGGRAAPTNLHGRADDEVETCCSFFSHDLKPFCEVNGFQCEVKTSKKSANASPECNVSVSDGLMVSRCFALLCSRFIVIQDQLYALINFRVLGYEYFTLPSRMDFRWKDPFLLGKRAQKM